MKLASIEEDVTAIITEFAHEAGYSGVVGLHSPLCVLGLDGLDRSQLLDRLEQHFEVLLDDKPGAAATVLEWIAMVSSALHNKKLRESAEI